MGAGPRVAGRGCVRMPPAAVHPRVGAQPSHAHRLDHAQQQTGRLGSVRPAGTEAEIARDHGVLSERLFFIGARIIQCTRTARAYAPAATPPPCPWRSSGPGPQRHARDPRQASPIPGSGRPHQHGAQVYFPMLRRDRLKSKSHRLIWKCPVLPSANSLAATLVTQVAQAHVLALSQVNYPISAHSTHSPPPRKHHLPDLPCPSG